MDFHHHHPPVLLSKSRGQKTASSTAWEWQTKVQERGSVSKVTNGFKWFDPSSKQSWPLLVNDQKATQQERTIPRLSLLLQRWAQHGLLRASRIPWFCGQGVCVILWVYALRVWQKQCWAKILSLSFPFLLARLSLAWWSSVSRAHRRFKLRFRTASSFGTGLDELDLLLCSDSDSEDVS